jgi:hypothetical protein
MGFVYGVHGVLSLRVWVHYVLGSCLGLCAWLYVGLKWCMAWAWYGLVRDCYVPFVGLHVNAVLGVFGLVRCLVLCSSSGGIPSLCIGGGSESGGATRGDGGVLPGPCWACAGPVTRARRAQ